MEYQVINGKKFPPFPFHATGLKEGCIFEITGMFDKYTFLALFGREKAVLPVKDAKPVSITEIAFDEQPIEKKYRPWTNDDVKSLLFFRDKIFECNGIHFCATRYVPCSESVFLGEEDSSMSLNKMFDNLKYSTDGTNWLPCGVEI